MRNSVTYRTEKSDEGLLLLKVEPDRPAVKQKSIKSNPSIFEPLIGPVQNSQLGMQPQETFDTAMTVKGLGCI